jgi:protein-tyrosine phosphatase
MFDVHYHMLYGVDDGPKTLEDSLQLAEASIADGVTHIVCTPHSNDTYKFDPTANQERLAILSERLAGRLTLGLGCDFHLTFENVQDAMQNRLKYTINGKQYLLVEFPDYGVSQHSSDVLFQLAAKGFVPIITHPERNPDLQRKPERLFEWLRIGCLIQVTAGSLLGRFGKRAHAMSIDLIKKNWVHVVASDAHSVEGRPPAMTPAYRYLESEFGRDVADRLCIEIPKAVYFGKDLPPFPESEGSYSEAQPRRGFFSRIFARG